MYRTSIALRVRAPFRRPDGGVMRPLKPADAIRAVQITSRFPSVHGAPGASRPSAFDRIADIAKPDYR